jgi:iron complex outermembrane receptor protein
MYNYTGEFYHDIGNAVEEKSYGLLNANVTYQPESARWDVSLTADNITDEDYAAFRADFGWGDQLHWGYKRMMRAEFNLYF